MYGNEFWLITQLPRRRPFFFTNWNNKGLGVDCTYKLIVLNKSTQNFPEYKQWPQVSYRAELKAYWLIVYSLPNHSEITDTNELLFTKFQINTFVFPHTIHNSGHNNCTLTIHVCACVLGKELYIISFSRKKGSLISENFCSWIRERDWNVMLTHICWTLSYDINNRNIYDPYKLYRAISYFLNITDDVSQQLCKQNYWIFLWATGAQTLFFEQSCCDKLNMHERCNFFSVSLLTDKECVTAEISISRLEKFLWLGILLWKSKIA